MFSLFSSTPTFVGIEMANQTIKIATVTKQGHGYQIERCHQYDLPSHWENFLKCDSECAHSFLRIIEQTGIKGKPAILTVPAKSVLFKKIKVPGKASQEMIKTAIYKDLQSEFSEEDVCIDYIKMGPLGQQDMIYYAAANQEIVNDLVYTFSEAGLNVKVLDVDSYALQRIIYFLLPALVSEKTLGVIHLSGDQLTLIVYHQEIVEFQQIWHTSSVQVWEKINKKIAMIKQNQLIRLKNIVLCGVSQHRITVNDIVFHVPQFNQHIKAAADLLDHPFDYWVSCGAAMREIAT